MSIYKNSIEVARLFNSIEIGVNKILIICGGFQQLPAVILAKNMGMEVLVVDKNPNCVCKRYADKFKVINAKDYKKIIDYSIENKVDLAFTMQSDLPVRAMCEVNNIIKENSKQLDATIRCCNKAKTRKTLTETICPQPVYRVLNKKPKIVDISILWERIGKNEKAILKPVDSSGSRGVTIIEKPEQIQSAYLKAVEHSYSGVVIMEEFIDGVEFGAQTMSIGGKCVSIHIHSDYMNPLGIVPVGHSYPGEIKGIKRPEAEVIIKEAINSLGIINGPTNVDCIIDKNGKVFIIEVGARIGSVCLPELTSYYTGYDWINLSLAALSGRIENFTPPKIKKNHCSGIILQSNKTGLLDNVWTDKKLKESDECILSEIHAKKGDAVRLLNNGTDNIGRVIFGGLSNFKKYEKKCQDFQKKLCITLLND